ncbi:MAG: hypothetical protein A3E01_09405 [Gammaproteobacteria bacterium RIFCSPHIGHO2_12_FULL_63_22]|nr:MAG: hypothetical protein A3E01_09405 [Gammaproteobacteria bacterium RIFCSPHIGHO2_12_FULL_63_22]
MNEKPTILPLITVTPAAVTTVPVVQTFDLNMRTTLENIQLQLAGSYEQSVGAETMATEGNVSLIDSIWIEVDGVVQRLWKGPALYEGNRIMGGAALAQTDPAVGVAAGKAFSSTLQLDMGRLDLKDWINPKTGKPQSLAAMTYLDLTDVTKAILKVQFAAFNRYVSGNTQGSMTYTLRATAMELPGYRPVKVRGRQLHFDLIPVDSAVDMNITGTDRKVPLLRPGYLTRGLLLRVGSFGTTPNVTAITPLTNVGVKQSLIGGPSIDLKDKLPVSVFQNAVGNGRNGITLRAGYLWIDFASNKQYGGLQKGNALSAFDLVFDSAALANYQMQVFQACTHI